MAGNAREWCFNERPDGSAALVGGAWDDAAYMIEKSLSEPQRMAADRSLGNERPAPDATNDESPPWNSPAREPVVGPELTPIPDPVSDEVFAAMLSDYDYDTGELNAVIEEAVDFRYWTRQRMTIDGESDEDRS